MPAVAQISGNTSVWYHVVIVLDPVDFLGHYAFVAPPATAITHKSKGLSYPERLSPYKHYHIILGYSCVICRNYPYINHGFGFAKRAVRFPTLGIVSICRDHNRHKTSYCGVCYREATRKRDSSRDRVGCMSNEDSETWPRMHATCKQCRRDSLFRRAYVRIGDQEALGMLGSENIDDEARAAVEGFLAIADDSVHRILETVQDRCWLKKQIRMRQFRPLVAANRYETWEEDLQQLSASRATIQTHESDEDLDMDVRDCEEEEEDDPDIEQWWVEDHSAKSMALGDWAQNRTLGGFWVTPCDQWISGMILEVPRAEHPCPVTCGDDDDSGEKRPQQTTILGDVPPSYSLCERANYAYMKELRLRTLLLPPVKNILRMLVTECAADGCDAVRKACKISLDDVVHELKDEAVWFDGFDWLERRRNDRLQARKTEQRTRIMKKSSSSDDFSLSSKSDGSTTSPVLSTSTLQTTPTPPPNEAILIPVSPILDPPRLLRLIPYIPESLINLLFSKEYGEDACRPLYHCRCKICERAKGAEGVVQINTRGYRSTCYGCIEDSYTVSRGQRSRPG
ncbi:hypothetical protein IW261DRAFT_812121 [Armillaria novae-zelandiae]|uniref:Uncharacterized protein n=1 Tax=Armillaria novae-zelandiae TaxID=153914 RepID=A0AA39T8X1_9AGAR|nr:hypothetical protein IW261DRAFT_812121 [Armillaria novae-zelandiae]